jgi:hypothetical protein
MGAGLIIIRSLSGADYYDAVTDGGCDNTGESDCVDDILAAVTAYKAAGKDGLYFPAGEYLLSSALTVPDGTTLVGGGMTTAWLQGQVWFGSTSDFTDLKIGPASAGVSGLANTDGASGSSFTRCHFRGGGAESDAHNSSTVNLGDGYDLANLTFTDCEFERSLGTAWSAGSDFTHRDNTVSVYANGCTVETVTFDGCHFGVTNGVATGAQRMMVEVWTAHEAGNWWKNMTFTDCEFEASNIAQLDFACYSDSGQGDGVLVEGCSFRGSGIDMGGTLWAYAICLEWPKNIVIKNNVFYRCYEAAINTSNTGFSYDNALSITGNTFDWDTAYSGITAHRSIMVIHGANGTITGNTLTSSDALPAVCIELAEEGCTGNTVTGNTFNLNATETAILEYGGAADNTVTPNTINRS